MPARAHQATLIGRRLIVVRKAIIDGLALLLFLGLQRRLLGLFFGPNLGLPGGVAQFVEI